MDIENEQTYRITAEARWKVELGNGHHPARNACTLYDLKWKRYNVYINDSVEYIAYVQSVWYVTLNPETDPEKRIYRFVVRQTLKFTGAFGEAYFAFANNSAEENSIEQRIGSSEYFIEKKQFFIAAAGPEWNEEISDIADTEYFLNEAASNVEMDWVMS